MIAAYYSQPGWLQIALIVPAVPLAIVIFGALCVKPRKRVRAESLQAQSVQTRGRVRVH